jgi:hypothetical protein
MSNAQKHIRKCQSLWDRLLPGLRDIHEVLIHNQERLWRGQAQASSQSRGGFIQGVQLRTRQYPSQRDSSVGRDYAWVGWAREEAAIPGATPASPLSHSVILDHCLSSLELSYLERVASRRAFRPLAVIADGALLFRRNSSIQNRHKCSRDSFISSFLYGPPMAPLWAWELHRTQLGKQWIIQLQEPPSENTSP